MKKKVLFLIYSTFFFLAAGCSQKEEWKPNITENEVVDTPWVTPANPYKAPLYWSPYEYNIEDEQNTHIGYIPENVWSDNINWVEKNLLPYGYDMICIDGWGNMVYDPTTGYRKSHSSNWTHDYAWWSKELKSRGMRLGIYDNPLWVNPAAANAGIKVWGTQFNLSDLINWDESTSGFRWLQVDKPGAREYVDGFFKYYSQMGVNYLRIDFLSWYETGYDQWMGTVGAAHGKENYEKALRWMRESADKYKVFISLVMPNLYNDAEVENKYGHMIRVNEDTGDGGWWKFSDNARGQHRQHWSQYATAFDGYIYWSRLSGRKKMILDGDFIRINTFANNDEKKSVISLHLVAGGPVTISDQFNTIGNDLWLYQNEEMLALNKDGFVGKPLSNDPTNPQSQISKGQMTNGDWIIALFNRENYSINRSIDFSTLGISSASVRDLWSHKDLGSMASYSISLSAHACIVLKLVKNN